MAPSGVECLDALGKPPSLKGTMDYKIVRIHHNDHGVSPELIQWAVDTIAPTGFFLDTLPMPAEYPDLKNNLYGPIAGDEPVKGELMLRDSTDAFRQLTPFVNLPARPTRLITVIGNTDKDGNVVLFTAYGGPAAERVPSDPSLEDDAEGRARSEAFWAVHALSIDAKG